MAECFSSTDIFTEQSYKVAFSLHKMDMSELLCSISTAMLTMTPCRDDGVRNASANMSKPNPKQVLAMKEGMSAPSAMLLGFSRTRLTGDVLSQPSSSKSFSEQVLAAVTEAGSVIF